MIETRTPQLSALVEEITMEEVKSMIKIVNLIIHSGLTFIMN